MNDDSTFRTILGVGLLVLFPIVFYHRIKSQATGEKLDRRQEGLFILLTLRPVGALFMIGLGTYIVNPARMAWSSVALTDWVRWVGVGVEVVGGGLLVWTLRSLGANLTDTVVTRKAHTLVTHGPYRWVRHPFYAAVALLILAQSTIAANWFLLLNGALVLALLAIRTRREEEKLLARFGNDYRRYMERTGRFVPRSGT